MSLGVNLLELAGLRLAINKNRVSFSGGAVIRLIARRWLFWARLLQFFPRLHHYKTNIHHPMNSIKRSRRFALLPPLPKLGRKTRACHSRGCCARSKFAEITSGGSAYDVLSALIGLFPSLVINISFGIFVEASRLTYMHHCKYCLHI
jgi:hypothetical protein